MFGRAAASILLVGAVVLGTAGCNFFAPQRTLDQYSPGVGVSASIGEVKVLNAFALASGEDGALSLLLTVSNGLDRGQEVNLQFEAGGAKVTQSVFVNARETKSFGYQDTENELLVTDAEFELGGVFPVYFQWGTETGETMLVPVHGEELPVYSELVPEPAETAAEG